MAVLAQAGGTDALATAVVLAIFYMVIVRFMDLNEKEPLWAMGLVFAIGFFAAMLLYLIVGTPVLEVQLVGGAVIRELVKILAVGLAIGALEAIGRGRGWSEVDGPLDGVVYGMAVGFGFATGAVFIRELFVATEGSAAMDIIAQSPVGQLWPVALRGLSEGLFGAVIGAGYGIAALPGKAKQRTVLIIGSGVAAIVLHVAYNLFTRGAAGTGAGRTLALLGLFLPVLIVAGLIVWSLGHEKKMIAKHLGDERASGVVTDDDEKLLKSFGARRAAYLKLLMSGNVDAWGDLKALHNRQVQLAFMKERAAVDSDYQDEVERLRASIHMLHAEVAESTGRPLSTEGSGA